MNQDTKRLRTNRATINLDDYEQKLIDALVAYTGLCQADVLHRMVMAEARDLLLPEPMLELVQG